MVNLIVPLSALLVLAIAPGAGPAAADSGYQVAQLLFRQQVLVRIQRPVAVKPIEWTEKKGPKCVAADNLAGVLISRPDAVDLVMEGGKRIRARLDDDCPALNFYGGFYVRPNDDGKLCAGRDAIRARSGRMCRIDSFKKLLARR